MPRAFVGVAVFQVEVWDHDDIMPDEIIGTTVIDLEDRFFDPRWKAMDGELPTDRDGNVLAPTGDDAAAAAVDGRGASGTSTSRPLPLRPVERRSLWSMSSQAPQVRQLLRSCCAVVAQLLRSCCAS